MEPPVLGIRNGQTSVTDASRAAKVRICIAGLYSYPLFNPSCVSPFGGSEVRMALLARELAKYPDLDVSMVVFDHGQPRAEIRDGVTLYSWPGRHCPIRADCSLTGTLMPPSDCLCGEDGPAFRVWNKTRLFLKAHSPRPMVDLIRKLRYHAAAGVSMARGAGAFLRGERMFGWIRSHALRRADVRIYDEIGADVYIAHGTHDLTAELAYYCRRRGKKYVMLSGSDHDFVAAHNARSGRTDIYGSLGFLMVYAIENADLIVVQSSRQADLARMYFARDAVVIRNPVDTTMRFRNTAGAGKVLWVGKSDDRIKRPEMFVELARRFPQHPHLMVMNLAIDSIHRRILRMGKDIPNLEILTYVPYDQVENCFAEARLFVNTSAFEGFPDTFLQAAKYGVPIVSLQVDPGGMISAHGCGVVCGGEYDRLLAGVSAMMSDDRMRAEAGDRCRAYLAKYHNKDAVVPAFREAVLGLWPDGNGGGAASPPHANVR